MLSRFWGKRSIVPLLIINSSLNQEKTANLLNKLQKINYKNAKAIAMVIEIDNHMPVQVDKISQFLDNVRKEHSLKIYGFCHSNITLQSYYLLSQANMIYTMPSTIFQLQRGVRHFSTEELLRKFGIQKTTVKSDPKVLGASLDSFTSANTSKFMNTKFSEIAQRIYRESVSNRQVLKGVTLESQAPETMIGQQALQKKYVDRFGSYYDVLKTEYPECQLRHVRIREKMSTRTLELLLASPIIIVLFIIKVIIKYAIIMYLWIKHTKKEKK